jgi:hypothetical protein
MDGVVKREPFPWGIMALSCLVMYVCTFMASYKWLNTSLGDTDDALRLVQLRQFILSGNWYDLHIDRLSPPLGYTSHWSRLPDAIMAGIYTVVRPFSSAEFAELATRAVYPGLWIIPATLGITLFSYRILGYRLVVVVTLLLVASNLGTFPQFVAGRIDHHDAQITLSIWAVVSAAFCAANWRNAIIAGLCSGLLLTIGLEGLPFLIVAAAAICIRYIVFDDGRRVAGAYAVSIGVATAIGLAVSLPPARWFETACDALAFNLTAATVVGGATLFAWTCSSALNGSSTKRGVGVGLAGLLAAICYTVLDPACLHGPFAHVNPAVKPVWLDLVIEMQPVFTSNDWTSNIDNLVYVIYAIPAVMAVFWLLRDAQYRNSFPFLVMVTAFAVSLVTGLLNLRMSSYLVWFATPILCVAVFHLFKKLGEEKKILALFVIIIASPIVLEVGATQAGNYLVKNAKNSEISFNECAKSVNYAKLAKLPQGVVLSEIDLGPYILALTPHSVIAAPYHRIGDSILDVINFFNNDTIEQAHKVSEERKVSYVVICNRKSPGLKTEKISHLYQAIISGNLPEWLVVESVDKGNPIEVYRVNDGVYLKSTL